MSVYDTMNFPKYIWKEFPKWVTRKDGSKVVVASAQEELKVLATDPSEAKQTPAEKERDALALELAELKAKQADVPTPAPKVVPAAHKPLPKE